MSVQRYVAPLLLAATLSAGAQSFTYSNDPLVSRLTPIRRVHVSELRTAVDNLRQRGGLSGYSWSDAQPSVVRAVHVVELRAALAQALSALGRTPPSWTDSLTPGTVVRGRHIQEIRDATQLGRNEVGGTLTTNTTWTAANSPYVVTHDLVVTSGATLTILPGTIVKFAFAADLHILEGSRLIADGTASAPIIFTSLKDDAAGGDTNGDGATTTPARGDWSTLAIGNPVANNNQPAFGSVTHAVIRYGAQFMVRFSAPTLHDVMATHMSGDGLYLEAPPAGAYVLERLTLTDNERNLNLLRVPASTTIRKSIIRRATGMALQAVQGTAALIEDNSIDYNSAGAAIITDGSCPLVLRYNSITNNRTPEGYARGVRATSCCVNVDAKYNWWGSTTGPEMEGQPNSGGGGQVGSNVLYDPWLGQEWAGAFKAGDHAWTLKAGVGVDVATGNFFLTETDFSIRTVGFPLEVRRTFNSKIAGGTRSDFGEGWSWNYGTHLETTVDAHGIIWRREDGAGTYFKRNPDNTFSSEEGVFEKLVYVPSSNTYRMTRKDQSVLVFAGGGTLTAEVDANGNTTAIERDASGRVTRVTEPKGRTLTFEYQNGYIWRITDPLQRTYLYQRNPNGAIASVVKQANGSTFATANYSYGPGGRWEMTGFKDADGNGLEQEFDLAQRVIEQHFNGNEPIRFAYGETTANSFYVGPYTTMVWDTRGRAHAYFYTASNKVLAHDRQHILDNGWTWMREDTWEYVSYFTSSYRNPDGKTTSKYDWNTGNLTELVEPGARTTTYTYDAFNNRRSATDELGRVSRYEYDAQQRLIKATDPAGNVSTTEYYADGLLLHSTDARGRVTFYTYDGNGYPRSVTSAEQETVRFTYDAGGRKIAEENHLGERTTYSYDGRDNVVDITDPLGNRTSYRYDEFGRKTQVTDAENRTTRYEYSNTTNALTRTIDARGGAVELTRDTFGGNITAVKDPNQHVTTFTYDDLNRRTSETDPLARTWRFEYVGRDRLFRRTDAAGAVTRFDYNQFNLVSQVTYPDGSIALFEYDRVGNRTRLHDWTGSTSWAYDALNRVVHVGKGSQSTQYTYDAVGNLEELTYETGKTIRHSYDDVNRLRAVIDWNSRVTTYAYDDAGRILVTAYPNGVDGRWTYDLAGRPTAIRYTRGGTTLASAEYTYDRAGNRVSRRHTDGRVESYAYDELYRLLAVQYPDGQHESFTYDAGGNRTSRFDSRRGSTRYFSYDAADQMLNDDWGTRSYSENGALVTDSTRTFRWNAQQLLAEVIDGERSSRYTYDGEGRRVHYASGGVAADQVVDTVTNISRVLREVANGTSRYFVYGNGLVAAIEGGDTYFHHADALGSTILVTRGDGSTDGTYAYDAFGRIRQAAFAHGTNRRFTGEETDATELIYLRARYYEPLSGRFLSRDPFPMDGTNSQATNRYVYVQNNPANDVDPSGEITQSTRDSILLHLSAKLDDLRGVVADLQRRYANTPDYYSVTLSGGHPLLGVSGQFLIDADRKTYAGVGVGTGKALTGISGSVMAGWINHTSVTRYENELHDVLTGGGVSVTAGRWIGAGASWGGRNKGWMTSEVGFVSPQLGISVGYVWPLKWRPLH